MREIKFRGKRIDNGEWVYGYYVELFDVNTNKKAYRIYTGIAEKDTDEWFQIYFDVDPQTIGQYTGLCDKNEKEIYEGDIWEDEDGYSVIVWNEKYACFSVDFYGFNQWIGEGGQECYGNKIEFLDREDFAAFDSVGIEITKNIHDNPELLEEV